MSSDCSLWPPLIGHHVHHVKFFYYKQKLHQFIKNFTPQTDRQTDRQTCSILQIQIASKKTECTPLLASWCTSALASALSRSCTCHCSCRSRGYAPTPCCRPRPASALWASLGVDLDKNPGGYFLDKLCCKSMFFDRVNLFLWNFIFLNPKTS